MPRTAQIHRQTGETNITLALDLDGTGQSQIQTGVGFFDHMLTLLAKHSLIDLNIQAQGDICTSMPITTVEDVGICFGKSASASARRQGRIRRTAR